MEEGYEAVGIEVTDAYYALGTERVSSALEMGKQNAETKETEGKVLSGLGEKEQT